MSQASSGAAVCLLCCSGDRRSRVWDERDTHPVLNSHQVVIWVYVCIALVDRVLSLCVSCESCVTELGAKDPENPPLLHPEPRLSSSTTSSTHEKKTIDEIMMDIRSSHATSSQFPLSSCFGDYSPCLATSCPSCVSFLPFL